MFYFDTDEDKILAMMFGKIIKNGGTWEKRGHRYMGYEADGRNDADGLDEMFGVKIKDGEKVITLHGYNKWAEYGSRSIIPVLFMYVTDNLGVVKKYKVRGDGNLRDGWAPNKDKTELLWERGEVETPEWMVEEKKELEAAAKEEAENPKKDIPAGKYAVTGRVISLKTSYYEMAYSVSVTTKMLVELDDGSRVYGTCPSKLLDDVKEDIIVEFTATFKPKEPGFAIFTRPSKAKIIG